MAQTTLTHSGSDTPTYQETYTYDSLGRPSQLSRQIDGATYLFDTTYDSQGRLLKTLYPTVNGTRFGTRQVYNGLGFLREIRANLDADDGRPVSELQGKIYWMADHHDAAGRIDAEILGNGLANDRSYSLATGRLHSANVDRATRTSEPYAIQQLVYTYDEVGNVLTRADQAMGRGESFGYDGLYRLTSDSIVTGLGSTVRASYDAKGNIVTKSNVGTCHIGSKGL